MSSIAIIIGKITYKDNKSYNQAQGFLEENGWIYGSEWLDIDSETPCFDDHELSIIIPYGVYQNLHREFDTLLIGSSAVIGRWISTDGTLSGGLIGSGPLDMSQWAQTNVEPEPKIEDFTSTEEYQENQSVWLNNLSDTFMNK